MLLTPPSRATFIIAIVLAIIALLVQYASARIPMASGHAFETLLLAFIVLVAGNPGTFSRPQALDLTEAGTRSRRETQTIRAGERPALFSFVYRSSLSSSLAQDGR